jgi:hypothetical protein
LIKSKLESFTPKSAEQIYGEIYKHCQTPDFSADEARSGMVDIMAFGTSDDLVQHSYALLMLGAVIDSGKLPQDDAGKIEAYFIEHALKVSHFEVLNQANNFVHLVSHFAYLAASYCEQFDVDQHKIIDEMLALYLRAPSPYWCGVELLVARLLLEAKLPDVQFDERVSSLQPQTVMQQADQWDAGAVALWQKAMIVENHKRQLLMALQLVNGELLSKPSAKLTPFNKAIFASKFG